MLIQVKLGKRPPAHKRVFLMAVLKGTIPGKEGERLMGRRLPPLNSLRAFEAAARHLSFAKAADELHVTAAAISHQIKGLESQLGTLLFRRLNRSVALTPAGERLLGPSSRAFDLLAEAVAEVERGGGPDVLSVSVAPSLAAKWLIPRLQNLYATHPELDVRMSASMALADFQRDGFDIALRFGLGRYAGCRSHKLMDDSLVPLCAPSLASGDKPIRVPGDLQNHVLLHDDSGQLFDPTAPTWQTWLTAAGVEGVDVTRGPRFGQPDMALAAAIDGVGVTLGRVALARADLAAGRLVAPFALTLPLAPSYYVVYPEEYESLDRVRIFRDWLLAVAAADAPMDPATLGSHLPDPAAIVCRAEKSE